ncbi:hypothetical protein B0H66DRAFT_560782 [Apodospora peruviana]|uniref:Uncharacterized protein n=1 Tax=Apodospora peruviana TaxID=516989 RepID=A0AAE0I0H6_9PEZI|nr:hypothetical protein B0H66DRAFT_560782 [Apodospora peruviana]
MSHDNDIACIEQDSGLFSQNEATGDAANVITIRSVFFVGTGAELPAVSGLSYSTSASYDPFSGQDTISATCLQSLVQQCPKSLRRWAESEKDPLFVMISWTFLDTLSPVFTGKHRLVPDNAAGVVFTRDLNQERALANHVRVIATTPDDSSRFVMAQQIPQPPNSRMRNCATAWEKSTAGRSELRRVFPNQAAPGGRYSTSRPPNQDAERQRPQRILLDASRRYAEDVFRTSRDTRELLRTTQLSQGILASQLQVQGPRYGYQEASVSPNGGSTSLSEQRRAWSSSS